jgi:hypothetical protein
MSAGQTHTDLLTAALTFFHMVLAGKFVVPARLLPALFIQWIKDDSNALFTFVSIVTGLISNYC